MDIRVYNRQEAELTEFIGPHVIISISLPGDPNGTAKLRTNRDTLGVLQLTFWDLDRLVPVDPDLVDDVRRVSGITYEMERQLFEPRHARAILAFVATYPEALMIVCHCDAGLSRSPGVAAALSKILLGEDDDFFKKHSGLNRRVYRMILDAAAEAADTGDDNGDRHH